MNSLMIIMLLVSILKVIVVIFVCGIVSGFLPSVGKGIIKVVRFIFKGGEVVATHLHPWSKKIKEAVDAEENKNK